MEIVALGQLVSQVNKILMKVMLILLLYLSSLDICNINFLLHSIEVWKRDETVHLCYTALSSSICTLSDTRSFRA